MFKKKILNNKHLFFLLIIYTISHIFFYTSNFYINFINPLFWLVLLIFFYHQDFNLPKQKETSTALMISIIFFILYFMNGLILGFNKNLSNFTFINIFINIWKVILPIYGIEIIRYKLLKSNKNYFSFKCLITTLIILSEINFKTLFLSHNIIFFHYFISIIIPMIAQNILYTYLSLNSHYNISIIIRLFDEVPKFFFIKHYEH